MFLNLDEEVNRLSSLIYSASFCCSLISSSLLPFEEMRCSSNFSSSKVSIESLKLESLVSQPPAASLWYFLNQGCSKKSKILIRSSGSLLSMLSIARRHSLEISDGGLISFFFGESGTAVAADEFIFTDYFLWITFLYWICCLSSSEGGSIYTFFKTEIFEFFFYFLLDLSKSKMISRSKICFLNSSLSFE